MIKFKENFDLGSYCWLGAPAVVARALLPKNRTELLTGLSKLASTGTAITIIGAGSNSLVRSGGIAGAVVVVDKAINAISQQPEHQRIRVEAGCLCPNLAAAAARYGLAGLEFLVGIPGSIGGAVAMNAGCYGSQLSEVLQAIEVWQPGKGVVEIAASDLSMGYRNGGLANDMVVLAATLQGRAANQDEVKAKMQVLRQRRQQSQPIQRGTGGSSFRNPFGPDTIPKAWQLIAAAGGRGLRQGGAKISERHCNFMLNCGAATPEDFEKLGDEICRRVLAHAGVKLDWEIKLLGTHPSKPARPNDRARTAKMTRINRKVAPARVSEAKFTPKVVEPRKLLDARLILPACCTQLAASILP